MRVVEANLGSPAAPALRASLVELAGSRSLRMVLVLLLLWTGLAIYPETREAFLTAGNFSNLTAQVAEIVIIGVGMTMVILIGGIDLSVGSGMALCGVVAAELQIDHHQPAWVAILAAIAVATVVGGWHGLLVSRFQIPPFIATLSGFSAYRGLALVLSNARGLSPMSPDFAFLGGRVPGGASFALIVLAFAFGVTRVVRKDRRRRHLALPPRGAPMAASLAAMAAVTLFLVAIYQDGMPVPVLLAALATGAGAFVLRQTRFGRHAVAIGGNVEAARVVGIPVARVTILIYLLTGVLTALAGLVVAARTNGVTPANMGLKEELNVISAVVIGGTSLTGGRATMVGTVIGALIFGTLSNGMNHLGVSSNWQPILTGMILVGASLLDSPAIRKK